MLAGKGGDIMTSEREKMTHVDKAKAWDAVAEKNKRIANLEAENEKLEAEIRRLTLNNMDLQKHYKAENEALGERITDHINAHHDEVVSLKAENESLQGEIRALNDDINALRARVNEHLELYDIIDKLEAENEALRAEVSRIRRDARDAVGGLEELAEDLKTENEGLKEENKKLQAYSNAQFKKDTEEISEQAGRIAELEAEIVELQFKETAYRELAEVRKMTDFHDFAEDHAEWSDNQFGLPSVRGPEGPLKHLQKEVKEALAQQNDVSEYADCLLLVLDAARRAGFNSHMLLDAAITKLHINIHREWPKLQDPNLPVEHSKDCAKTKGGDA